MARRVLQELQGAANPSLVAALGHLQGFGRVAEQLLGAVQGLGLGLQGLVGLPYLQRHPLLHTAQLGVSLLELARAAAPS